MGFWNRACAAGLVAWAIGATPVWAASFTVAVSGLNNPFGLASDAAGNLYIADVDAGLVKEAPAPSYDSVITLSSAIGAPAGIAVDSHGNLFVTDDGDETVKELLAPAYTTVVPLAGGFSLLRGIAVDTQDNVFVADQLAGKAYELPVSNYGSPVQIGGTINSAFGIALDGAGNVFVTEQLGGSGTIIEILAAGGYATTRTLSVQGADLRGIAVDRFGNLFYTALFPSAVFEAPTQGGYGTSTQLAGSNLSLNAVALDPVGNLYVAAGGLSGEILKLAGVEPVPALGSAGLALLALVLGGVSYRMLRRHTVR